MSLGALVITYLVYLFISLILNFMKKMIGKLLAKLIYTLLLDILKDVNENGIPDIFEKFSEKDESALRAQGYKRRFK